ncbi:hypothetical protein [Streptomyces sp. NPDC052036]|uniref:hypothetical protein n=1 Tax=Streptomyces sp. NPDC052036 TaxID=3155171 RepID=UPI003446F99D
MEHTTEAGREAVLRHVLDQWKGAVERHEPQRVASVFTENAIFQGLHPYSVGRPGVAEYYDSQPLGMTLDYRILETRHLGEDLVLGYLGVDFMFVDRPAKRLNLGVLVTHLQERWYISHYQVSGPLPDNG